MNAILPSDDRDAAARRTGMRGGSAAQRAVRAPGQAPTPWNPSAHPCRMASSKRLDQPSPAREDIPPTCVLGQSQAPAGRLETQRHTTHQPTSKRKAEDGGCKQVRVGALIALGLLLADEDSVLAPPVARCRQCCRSLPRAQGILRLVHQQTAFEKAKHVAFLGCKRDDEGAVRAMRFSRPCSASTHTWVAQDRGCLHLERAEHGRHQQILSWVVAGVTPQETLHAFRQPHGVPAGKGRAGAGWTMTSFHARQTNHSACQASSL